MRRVAGIITIAVGLAVGAMLGPAILVAEAHTCSGENPSQSCGECTSGNHHHSYLSDNGGVGKTYCTSSDDLPVPEEPPQN